ncbi:MAG: hypothetical protein MUO80_02300 [Dehalococcoidia bacterium]|nr:hypothetical protein [Dehalococcoidia bacterium]
MERYVIPRNKGRHLIVSEGVHQVVLLYATERQLTLVEATYRLLKLGLCHEYNLPVPDSNVDRYEMKKPPLLDIDRWFRKIKQ